MDLEFEWDESKALANEQKHGLAFKDAAAIFLGEDLLIQPDRRHDYGEDRYQAIGRYRGREIVVIYTIRDDRIRIISARKAHDNEQRAYCAVYGLPGGERRH